MEFQSMEHLKLPERHEVPPGDALEIMLQMQKNLNQKVYPKVLKNLGAHSSSPLDVSLTFYKEELTKEYLLAIIRECCEALDMINSKPWRDTIKPVNEVELKYEFIDLQHFMLTLYELWGMDKFTILRYYIAKNNENRKRVQDGY